MQALGFHYTPLSEAENYLTSRFLGYSATRCWPLNGSVSEARCSRAGSQMWWAPPSAPHHISRSW